MKKKAVRHTYGEPLYATDTVQINNPGSPYLYNFTVYFAVRKCLQTNMYHIFRYKSINGDRTKMPFVDRRGKPFAKQVSAEDYAEVLLSRYVKRGAKKVQFLKEPQEPQEVRVHVREMRDVIRKCKKVVKMYDGFMGLIDALRSKLSSRRVESRLLFDLENAASDLCDVFETAGEEIDVLMEAARKVRRKYGIR